MTAFALAFITTFVLVTLAELPDKTTMATLVLTTRFSTKAVFAGAGVAFVIQSIVAVAFGSLLTLLPDSLVSGVVAVLFGVGAALLLREGFAAPQDSGADAARSGPTPATFASAAMSSFGILFVAEWGDASQLAAAGMAAQYSQPIAVGLGTFLSLLSVTALAVFIGGKLRDRIRPQLLQRCAGFVFAGFALFAAGQALL